jgi:hypothetical protein
MIKKSSSEFLDLKNSFFSTWLTKKKHLINLNKNIFDPKTLSNPFKNIKLNQIKKSQVSIYFFQHIKGKNYLYWTLIFKTNSLTPSLICFVAGQILYLSFPSFNDFFFFSTSRDQNRHKNKNSNSNIKT